MRGATRFAGDLAVPGLLHARLVLAHEAHARIRGIDTDAAQQIPGVVAVLTAADLPIVARGKGRMYEPLAREEVVYAGQPVGIVVAESDAVAEDAAQLVEVDLEPLEPVLDVEAAAAPGAPRARVIVADEGDGSDIGDAHAAVSAAGIEGEELSDNVLGTARLADGDVDAALADSAVVVRGRFTTPWMYQGYLETQSATAWLEPEGELVITSSTQAPFGTRDGICELFGLTPDRVRVRTAPLGGAFGGKLMIIDPLVVAAVLAVRRPVRLALTRSEDIAATNPAGAEIMSLEVGADAEGRLTGIRARVYVDRGSTDDFGVRIIERSSPTRRLKRVDFPTLGRPTRATRGIPSSVAVPATRSTTPSTSVTGPSSSRTATDVVGKAPTTSSSRSPVPRPCSTLTAHGSPRPRERASHTSASRCSESTLFTTTRTCRPDFFQHPGHGQVLVGQAHGHVDHEEDDVGLGDGALGLGADLGVKRVVGGEPPAGVDDGEVVPTPLGVQFLAVAGHARPFLDHGRPPADDAVDQGGLADVRAARHHHQGLAAGRGFGLDGGHRGAPRVTGTRADRWGGGRLEGTAQREAVGGDHLDGPGQVGQGEVVEEPALREAGVGQEVAVALGLVVEHGGEVGAGQQAGDPDVASEEIVAHRNQSDVVPAERFDQGCQHQGAVLPGQDGDRRDVAPLPRRHRGRDGSGPVRGAR